MKCNSTLRNLFALTIALITGITADATVYVNNGGNTSYNLASGDSLYIQSGTYTGYIGQFDQGAKITVAAGASFQPNGINNARGIIKVLGTFKVNFWFGSNGGFGVENYGTTWFSQGAQLNEGPQVWTNNFGGTFRFDQGVTMNGTTFLNKGSFISSNTVTVNNNSSFTNNNEVSVNGGVVINASSFNNGGKFNLKSLTLTGNTNISNSCRLAVDGPVTNYAKITNSGLIWSTNVNNNSKIDNGGGSTLTNTETGVVKSVDFVNNGTMSGSGYWYFTGNTQNYGTVGQNGTGSNFLKIYDMTRTKNSQIFDTEYGNVYASAKFTTQTAPDTTTLQTSCSSESRSVTLAVKWDYFYVNLSDNTPVLSWGAEQDPGTVFQVQRSYDAVNFTTIGSFDSKMSSTAYKFEDKQVSASAKTIFYRIRAVEPAGAITLSETKTLIIGTKAGVSVQAVPNPFTSQLNISYQSPVREKINIRIVSITGTVMTTKAVNVSTGFNSIAITEAASLNKGIYLVQLISGNTVIASERVIKQ